MRIKRWHAFCVWAVGSLFAIALLGEQLYWGLGIAVLSGIAFGAVNWFGARQAQTEKERSKGKSETV